MSSSFFRHSWKVRSLYALREAVLRPPAEHQRTRPVPHAAHLYRIVMVTNMAQVISPSIIC